jgi:hypothetical protein
MIIIIIIITVFQVCVCNDNEENVILNYPHTRYVWWWRLLMSRHFFLKINKRNEEGGPCCVSFLPFLFTCRLRIKKKTKVMIVDGGDQCSLIVGVWISNVRSSCFNIDFDYIFLSLFCSINILTECTHIHSKVVYDWFYICEQTFFKVFS